MFGHKGHRPQHRDHAFVNYNGRTPEGLTVVSRRGMLKASMAGIAGLSLPELLRTRAEAAANGRLTKSSKSCILRSRSQFMAAGRVMRAREAWKCCR
jgi:hypothetical protein